MLPMTSEMSWGIGEGSATTIDLNAEANENLKRQLAEPTADATKLQQHYEQQIESAQQQQKQHEDSISALQAEVSRLQIDNLQLTDDNMALLETKQELEDTLLDFESREYDYQQTVADLQGALAAATSLPPPYPQAIASKPWTVPAMHKKIEQLTLQLADLQERYEEVQQPCVQASGMEDVYDDLAEKEFEVAALSSTVTRLQQENLRLDLQHQGSLDVNKQLKEQVAGLHSQLKQLQDSKSQQEEAHEHQLAEANQEVANLQASLATLPDMTRKIEELTQELADVQGEYNELQQFRVQNAVVQEVHDDLAEKEREMLALSNKVAALEQENTWLRNESQSALDGRQQLQEQAADLQSQLQQLQDTITNVQKQQAQQQQQQQFEVAELSSTISRLREENLRLDLEHQGSMDVNEQLKDQVADLQSQLKELQDSNGQQVEAYECQLAEAKQTVANLQASLATLPDMTRKIEQLTQELADVQGEYDELQQFSVQNAVVQELHDDLAEKEREVLALKDTVAALEQENIWLRNESQSVLDGRQQLQEQAADLQSQLQQLQDTITNMHKQQGQQQQQEKGGTDEALSTVPQQQLEPLRMVRAGSDPADAPGTPDLVEDSFTDAHSRVLQPDPDNSSSSRRCSADSLATTGKSQRRGSRGLRVGQAVMSAAAAGVLIFVRLRAART